MHHPDIGFHVETQVLLYIHLHRDKGPGDDVIPALKKTQLCPLFPLGYGPGDGHGPGAWFQDDTAGVHMDPEPGVKSEPVFTFPSDVILYAFL